MGPAATRDGATTDEIGARREGNHSHARDAHPERISCAARNRWMIALTRRGASRMAYTTASRVGSGHAHAAAGFRRV